jgi:hypothetical protein
MKTLWRVNLLSYECAVAFICFPSGAEEIIKKKKKRWKVISTFGSQQKNSEFFFSLSLKPTSTVGLAWLWPHYRHVFLPFFL